jgi:hypothetical protein
MNLCSLTHKIFEKIGFKTLIRVMMFVYDYNNTKNHPHVEKLLGGIDVLVIELVGQARIWTDVLGETDT